MRLYRGIGADGASVVFVTGAEQALVGEAAVDAVAKEFSGTEPGSPEPGTVAKHIADIALTLDITPVDDGAEFEVVEPDGDTVAKDDDIATVKFSKSVIEREPNEAMMRFSKSIIEHGMGWIAKADGDGGELGVATGIVLEPNKGEDGKPIKPDTQGEIFGKDVVRDTAFDWLANGGNIDFMHSFQTLNKEDAHVVECWLTRGKYMHGKYECNEGTWMMSARFNPKGEFWKAIKSGKLMAWSPGGLAAGKEVEVPAEALSVQG